MASLVDQGREVDLVALVGAELEIVREPGLRDVGRARREHEAEAVVERQVVLAEAARAGGADGPAHRAVEEDVEAALCSAPGARPARGRRGTSRAAPEALVRILDLFHVVQLGGRRLDVVDVDLHGAP